MSTEAITSPPDGSVSRHPTKPRFQHRFRPALVKEVIHKALQKLHGLTYHPENASTWAREIADDIKTNLKELHFDRYKYCVQVILGEQRGEGARNRMGFRSLWDKNTDNFAEDIFMNLVIIIRGANSRLGHRLTPLSPHHLRDILLLMQAPRTSARADFEVLKFLGKGSYGSVYKVLRKADGRESGWYALKEVNIRYMSQKEREEAVNEIRILASFSHPNIIRYCEAFIEDDKLCIITEFASHGDLLSKIKKRHSTRRYFSEDMIWSFFIQLCVGLQYLHGRNVLHRDIKSANVFLTANDNVKIGDLGVAKLLKGKDSLAKTSIGTPYYLSPEIWQNRPYNIKSDIWSLGCVLYEMCTLQRPFDAQSMEGLARRVLSGRYAALPPMYSSELSQILANMLAIDPRKRPDLAAILTMPCVTRRMHLAPQSPYTPRKPPPMFVLQNTIRIPRAAKGGHIPSEGLRLPPAAYPSEESFLHSSDSGALPSARTEVSSLPGAALMAWIERDTGCTMPIAACENPVGTPVAPGRGRPRSKSHSPRRMSRGSLAEVDDEQGHGSGNLDARRPGHADDPDRLPGLAARVRAASPPAGLPSSKPFPQPGRPPPPSMAGRAAAFPTDKPNYPPPPVPAIRPPGPGRGSADPCRLPSINSAARLAPGDAPPVPPLAGPAAILRGAAPGPAAAGAARPPLPPVPGRDPAPPSFAGQPFPTRAQQVIGGGVAAALGAGSAANTRMVPLRRGNCRSDAQLPPRAPARVPPLPRR